MMNVECKLRVYESNGNEPDSRHKDGSDFVVDGIKRLCVYAVHDHSGWRCVFGKKCLLCQDYKAPGGVQMTKQTEQCKKPLSAEVCPKCKLPLANDNKKAASEDPNLYCWEKDGMGCKNRQLASLAAELERVQSSNNKLNRWVERLLRFTRALRDNRNDWRHARDCAVNGFLDEKQTYDATRDALQRAIDYLQQPPESYPWKDAEELKIGVKWMSDLTISNYLTDWSEVHQRLNREHDLREQLASVREENGHHLKTNSLLVKACKRLRGENETLKDQLVKLKGSISVRRNAADRSRCQHRDNGEKGRPSYCNGEVAAFDSVLEMIDELAQPSADGEEVESGTV